MQFSRLFQILDDLFHPFRLYRLRILRVFLVAVDRGHGSSGRGSIGPAGTIRVTVPCLCRFYSTVSANGALLHPGDQPREYATRHTRRYDAIGIAMREGASRSRRSLSASCLCDRTKRERENQREREPPRVMVVLTPIQPSEAKGASVSIIITVKVPLSSRS